MQMSPQMTNKNINIVVSTLSRGEWRRRPQQPQLAFLSSYRSSLLGWETIFLGVVDRIVCNPLWSPGVEGGSSPVWPAEWPAQSTLQMRLTGNLKCMGSVSEVQKWSSRCRLLSGWPLMNMMIVNCDECWWWSSSSSAAMPASQPPPMNGRWSNLYIRISIGGRAEESVSVRAQLMTRSLWSRHV